MSNPRQHLIEIENKVKELNELQESIHEQQRELSVARHNVVRRIVMEENLLRDTEWEIESTPHSHLYISYTGTRDDKLMKPINDLCAYDWHDEFDLGNGIKICFNDSDVMISYENTKDLMLFVQKQKLKINGTNVSDNIKSLKRKVAALELIAHQFNIK